mmetsp:Transcript_24/g.45  ORF Transcript_24/g.45 Transcript_24/m.45 type:complete len:237 (+) Transcript_24:668-1378(+)
MLFLYCCAACTEWTPEAGELSQHRSKTLKILAEYSSLKGNFQDVIEKCSFHMEPNQANPSTYSIDQYYATLQPRGNLRYGLICTNEVKLSVRRAVLEQLISHCDDILCRVDSDIVAKDEKVQQKLRLKMKQLLDHANLHPAEYDKVQKTQQDMEDVKAVVLKNVDKVIQRGENIDNLKGKTDALEVQAGEFKKSALGLKQQLWMQHKKAIAIAAAVGLLLVLLVALTVAGVLGKLA